MTAFRLLLLSLLALASPAFAGLSATDFLQGVTDNSYIGNTGDRLRVESTQSGSWSDTCLQGGTWTVQPGNTANTTAWKVDGSAVTQPVSSTTLATAANQSTEITSLQLLDDIPAAMNGAFAKGAPAMGQLDDTSTTAATEDNVAPVRITAQRAFHVNLRNNAGTELGTSGAPVRIDPTGTTTQPVSGTVTANVGTTNGLALDATVAKLNVAQGAATGSNTGPMAQGVTTTAAPSYTTATINPLSLTTTGALRTDSSATTQPVSGTVTANQGGTWTVQPGNTANTTPWLVSSVPLDGTKASYSASAASIVAPVTPTDIFTITGSGTKKVRVLKVEITGTETTGAVRLVSLLKRSSADSSGTSTTMTNVPHESSDAAATATVKAYTANPTLGTLVGAIRNTAYDFTATNLSSASNSLLFDFSSGAAKAVVLSGTSEVLAVNFNSATMSGNSFNFNVEWTEE